MNIEADRKIDETTDRQINKHIQKTDNQTDKHMNVPLDRPKDKQTDRYDDGIKLLRPRQFVEIEREIKNVCFYLWNTGLVTGVGTLPP